MEKGGGGWQKSQSKLLGTHNRLFQVVSPVCYKYPANLSPCFSSIFSAHSLCTARELRQLLTAQKTISGCSLLESSKLPLPYSFRTNQHQTHRHGPCGRIFFPSYFLAFVLYFNFLKIFLHTFFFISFL